MELKINHQQSLQPIEFNFEELKKELSERLAFYKSLTYGPDELRTAKTDRANLNKFKDAIETRRKEVKAFYLRPYEDFEKKIKEIVAMIDEPIKLIDGQVKGFENKVREEKRAKIQEIYEKSIGELKELLPLDKLWNDRWLNATFPIKDVEEEITGTIVKVKNDLEVVSNLKSEFEFQIKDVYLQKLDLSAALQEKTRLDEFKAKQEAYERAKSGIPSPAILDDMVEPEPPYQSKGQQEEVLEVDFRVWATREQLQALKEFLKTNNIRYGRIDQ
jgi:hypothetical protein